MNSFDIKRFGQTLRWVVSVNLRKMLLWFTGSVLAVYLELVGFRQYGNSCCRGVHAALRLSSRHTLYTMYA